MERLKDEQKSLVLEEKYILRNIYEADTLDYRTDLAVILASNTPLLLSRGVSL